MGIQVNIAEAKARLSELLAAALRGEEVVLARAGRPLAQITPLEEQRLAAGEELARQRMANFGYAREAAKGLNFTVPPSMTDEQIQKREEKLLGTSA